MARKIKTRKTRKIPAGIRKATAAFMEAAEKAETTLRLRQAFSAARAALDIINELRSEKNKDLYDLPGDVMDAMDDFEVHLESAIDCIAVRCVESLGDPGFAL